MPPRDWRLRLKDIEQSIDRIATYIEGLDYETFPVIGEQWMPSSITSRSSAKPP